MSPCAGKSILLPDPFEQARMKRARRERKRKKEARIRKRIRRRRRAQHKAILFRKQQNSIAGKISVRIVSHQGGRVCKIKKGNNTNRHQQHISLATAEPDIANSPIIRPSSVTECMAWPEGTTPHLGGPATATGAPIQTPTYVLIRVRHVTHACFWSKTSIQILSHARTGSHAVAVALPWSFR